MGPQARARADNPIPQIGVKTGFRSWHQPSAESTAPGMAIGFHRLLD
jgi:hypothetical protein